MGRASQCAGDVRIATGAGGDPNLASLGGREDDRRIHANRLEERIGRLARQQIGKDCRIDEPPHHRIVLIRGDDNGCARGLM